MSAKVHYVVETPNGYHGMWDMTSGFTDELPPQLAAFFDDLALAEQAAHLYPIATVLSGEGYDPKTFTPHGAIPCANFPCGFTNWAGPCRLDMGHGGAHEPRSNVYPLFPETKEGHGA